MVNRDLIFSKANSVRKHVKRALEKSDVDIQTFLNDSDCQDIVLFNIQMAVQNCIDIAAHIISDEGLGVPGSNNEMFYMLEENDYLEKQLVEKMVKAGRMTIHGITILLPMMFSRICRFHTKNSTWAGSKWPNVPKPASVGSRKPCRC